MVFLKRSNRGISLVEVLVAASIILVAFLTLVTVYNVYLNKARTNLITLQGVYLAEEGIEAVKFIRNNSWNANIANLAVGTDYYLNFSNNAWSLSTTPSMIDGYFERKVNFGSVSRDSNFDITQGGGTIDPDTKKVTVSVAWNEKEVTTTKSLSTYITNLYGN